MLQDFFEDAGSKPIEMPDDAVNIITLNEVIEVNLDKGALAASKGTAEIVMNEVQEKIEDIKSLIKSIIDTKASIDEESLKLTADNLKGNINDVKIYNAISEQYYYLDMPMELYEKEYPCKFIIKDDRKQGKKLDSSNIKMVLSITTANLGAIDAFVTVKEKNMKVDFKCEEKWVPILEMAKEKLWQILNSSGYNIYINVDKRTKAADIVNCRDFFDELRTAKINTVV
jgi:hypothetical protein